jgi:uncharacterized protein with HEPN domain
MQPEVRKFLTDALECARSIQRFTQRRTIDDLLQDRLLRSAVYYEFTIIGEALTQMRRLDSATFDRITESPRIVGFRNQIIHGYQRMSDTVTWQIIQDKLPILITELEQLLAQ